MPFEIKHTNVPAVLLDSTRSSEAVASHASPPTVQFDSTLNISGNEYTFFPI